MPSRPDHLKHQPQPATVRAFFMENDMVPTYMDRCDAASGYQPPQAAPVTDDPRYWNGALYHSVISRMAAEARYNMRLHVMTQLNNHRHEIRHGVRVGSAGSLFESNGRMRQIWLRK